jgi:hypothetical protein
MEADIIITPTRWFEVVIVCCVHCSTLGMLLWPFVFVRDCASRHLCAGLPTDRRSSSLRTVAASTKDEKEPEERYLVRHLATRCQLLSKLNLNSFT